MSETDFNVEIAKLLEYFLIGYVVLCLFIVAIALQAFLIYKLVKKRRKSPIRQIEIDTRRNLNIEEYLDLAGDLLPSAIRFKILHTLYLYLGVGEDDFRAESTNKVFEDCWGGWAFRAELYAIAKRELDDLSCQGFVACFGVSESVLQWAITRDGVAHYRAEIRAFKRSINNDIHGTDLKI